MASAKKKTTVEIAEELIRPVLTELGLELWDVQYEKEGGSWFLRYYIDKPGGVNIGDCEAASRAVETRLDEADPIAGSYILEVSSPGLERLLSKDWHLDSYIGKLVSVRFIRPVQGARDYVGKLTERHGGEITLLLESGVEITFQKSEAAYMKAYVDFESGGLNR